MDVCKQKLIPCLCAIHLRICECFTGIQPHLPAPTAGGLWLLSQFSIMEIMSPTSLGSWGAALGSGLLIWEEWEGGLTPFVGELGAFLSVHPSGRISGRTSASFLDRLFPDICQDTNQTLFKPCQGSEEVPCNKPVPVSLSEEPCCPLHLRLPPQMYVPEQVLAVPQELGAAPTDLYLSAAELQPTESLPLEFSDVSGSHGKAAPLPS